MIQRAALVTEYITVWHQSSILYVIAQFAQSIWCVLVVFTVLLWKVVGISESLLHMLIVLELHKIESRASPIPPVDPATHQYFNTTHNICMQTRK